MSNAAQRPRLVLYTKQGAGQEADTKEVIDLLAEEGVKEEEVLSMECDKVLAQWLWQESGGRDTYPQLYAGEHRLGTLADLQRLKAEGKLRPLLGLPSASWWNAFRRATVTARPAACTPNAPGEVTYECVRTNWLWRQQRRVYRFGRESFARVRPDSGEVRQSWAYSDVADVSVRGPDSLVVTFKTGAEAQYLQSPHATAIRELLLARKNPPPAVPKA